MASTPPDRDYNQNSAVYTATTPFGGTISPTAADDAMVLDVQATTQEHSAQTTKALDEALVLVGSDAALQFNSAATSSSRFARFRLPIMERVIRFDAAQIDLLHLVSPAESAVRYEPTGLLCISA